MDHIELDDESTAPYPNEEYLASIVTTHLQSNANRSEDNSIPAVWARANAIQGSWDRLVVIVVSGEENGALLSIVDRCLSPSSNYWSHLTLNPTRFQHPVYEIGS